MSTAVEPGRRAAGVERRSAVSHVRGQYRYGLVLMFVLTLVVFEIATPATRWARALDVGLAGAALTVAVATSRVRGRVRRRRVRVVGLVAVIVLIGILAGGISTTGTYVILTLIVAAIPVTLVGGLVRLIGEEGVTGQVVAGALVMYLLVGLLFASLIGVVSHVEAGPYFAQGTGSSATYVYYSFTVLTTTGFGDYTARTSVGQAFAVLEMLSGQLYLVTVIGIVVGNFVGRRARAPRHSDDEASPPDQ